MYTGEPFELVISGSCDFGLRKVEQIDRYQDDVISSAISLENPFAWAVQFIDVTVRIMEEVKPLPPYVPKDDFHWDIYVYAGDDIFTITKIAFWSPEDTIAIREILFSTTTPYYHFDTIPVGYGCITGSYCRDRFTPFDNFPWDIIVKPQSRSPANEK